MMSQDIKNKPKNPRQRVQSFFRNENAILAIVTVAILFAFGSATGGVSLRFRNIRNVLLQNAIKGVATIGQAFVILSAGIDISVGGIALFSSILTAAMLTSAEHINILGSPTSVGIAVAVSLAAGLGWGTLNGLSVSRIGMPALIVTIAIWKVTTGAGFIVSGGHNIGHLPDGLEFLGGGNVAGVPTPVIIFIVVAAISYFLLHHTRYGRSLYAVGGNPISAWLSGIDEKKTRLSVYAISGLLAGLAGVLMASRSMSASMRTLEGLEMDTIAAACIGGISLIGGRGSIIGVVLGVIIIAIIDNGMSILGAGPAQQNIIKGVIIFSAVAIDYIRRNR